MTMVPAPSSVRISIRMEWGTRPSMMIALSTPQWMASMQHSTLGIMPPAITSCSNSSTASRMVRRGISVVGSFLSRITPAISVIMIRRCAPSAPAIQAAAVSPLMLYVLPSSSQPSGRVRSL